MNTLFVNQTKKQYFRLCAFTGKATRWSLAAKVFFAEWCRCSGPADRNRRQMVVRPGIAPQGLGWFLGGDHIVIVRGGDNSSKGIMPEDLLALQLCAQVQTSYMYVKQSYEDVSEDAVELVKRLQRQE